MIKAICFDLDGVYFTSDSFKNFKKHLPKEVNDEEKISYVLAKSDEMIRFKRGEMSEEEYWEYATMELKIKTDLDGICDCLRESYDINHEVADYVTKVQKAGYKTCICSNNFITRVRELDNEWGFLDIFDIKVFSYEVGFMKPAREIYQVLITKTGANPNEIVYADDDENKMTGAKDLGINTFIYTNFNDFKNKLASLGVYI
ncbi:hypothetical protein A3A69_01235 [candidate division WWE3 bacterium RIFCSPLOWO2_01_FULL_37_15]|uniref:Haloacid dehalogenase n=1 Tax=candidate division WWE3 bacterium RIFCSPLOWO2_01_FULL_37_15 TaxID=1802622 RepID=A0A1F4UTD5_UNCKA|nr:MAG: hypothetical protein A3A69_01235 [candidate division WWE3 bacterium RIFCSPLOWO2_01_FULL_37_15]